MIKHIVGFFQPKITKFGATSNEYPQGVFLREIEITEDPSCSVLEPSP